MEISLTLSEFNGLAKKYEIIPLFKKVGADCFTPVEAYQSVAQDNKHTFLLESVEQGKTIGRFSVIGNRTGNHFVIPKQNSVQGNIKNLLNSVCQRKAYKDPRLNFFYSGLVGYIAYDLVSNIEKKVKPIGNETNKLDMPIVYLLNCTSLIVFDHLYQVVYIIENVELQNRLESIRSQYNESCTNIDKTLELLNDNPHSLQPLKIGLKADDKQIKVNTNKTVEIKRADFESIPRDNYWYSNLSKQEYKNKILRSLKEIRNGELIQVNISQRLVHKTDADSFTIYRSLRHINPSPYMFYINYGEFQLIGSSPEMLVAVQDGKIHTKPIAGTKPRGATLEEDHSLQMELLEDEKELAEHRMLVDMGRNDLGRVAKIGTVKVPRLMQIEKFSHVMHITSDVVAELASQKTAIEAFLSVFPAGTVSGAPKIRAMKLISEIEENQREQYAGAVGSFDYFGNVSTCIALRMAVKVNDVVIVQAGGGIVLDSKVEKEYQESLNKMKAVIKAVDLAEKN